MKCTFRGSFAALPTPLLDDELDLASLRRLIDYHVERGSDGIVVTGTTGEASTLSEFERQSVIETAVERAAGRLPVLAGVGTNSTRTTVQGARAAAEAGVDGLLAVTPYYNRPEPRGLVAHFGALAEAVELPIVLYNVPGRTGCDLSAKTAAKLRELHPNIVAIKEAGGTVSRARELLTTTDLAVFAGEDALIADYCALGAVGVIGVVANLAPSQVAELCRCAAPGGDAPRGAELAAYLHRLVRDLFCETNPAPVKAALASLGLLSSEELRLPLVGASETTRERLRVALHEAGLSPRPAAE